LRAAKPDASTEARLAMGRRDCYRFVVLVASLASMDQFTIAVLLPPSEGSARRWRCRRQAYDPALVQRIGGAKELVNPGGTALDASRRLG
jgi:hypothetical protein